MLGYTVVFESLSTMISTVLECVSRGWDRRSFFYHEGISLFCSGRMTVFRNS